MTLTWADVLQRRLSTTALRKQVKHDAVADLVGRACCFQAQILSSSQLAVGLRVQSGTHDHLERAMWQDRVIVKTYGPRHTLHLVSAKDYPLWMAAMRAAYGIPRTPDFVSKAIGDSLDGRTLTRAELANSVERSLGARAPAGLRSAWGDHFRRPAYLGLLCFAKSEGQRVRFARADQWLPNWEDVDENGALLEVCRRYIRTFGPVTPRDFSRFLLIDLERAKSLFHSLGAELTEVKVGRSTCWMETANLDRPEPLTEPHVRLVPQYDPYVLNSQPRKAVVPDWSRALIKTFGQGRNEGAVGVPTVLINGEVAGIWQHDQAGGPVKVTIDCFVDVDDAIADALEAEAAKVAGYFGRDPELRLEELARRT